MRYYVPNIAAISQSELAARLQQILDNKTKPLGSLGRLEALAVRIGSILGSEKPELHDPQLVVFAGDHGLAARGVSAYPSDVTWQMVENFLAGGAAINVLARQHSIGLTVVDCGVRHSFVPRAGLLDRKIALGTADALENAAMTSTQRDMALAHGDELVKKLPGNVLLLGEMGIGNSSAASLLMSRLTGMDIAACTGTGTGLDETALERKIFILRDVLLRHADTKKPLDVLAAFGGFEIATMVGSILRAAVERRIILVDGFITTAAVLVASTLQPNVLERCIFAHRSSERGHELLLAHLQAKPLLDFEMRLGEGSGAAIVWPLLVSACAILCEMSSFESAGVSRQEDTQSTRIT